MNIFQLVLMIGAVQGVLLSVALFTRNYDKKKQNYYFLILVSLIAFALIAKLVINKERYEAFPHIWFLFDGIAYGIGPLWYFTIQKSILPKLKFSKKDALCLSPIIYYIGFIAYLITQSRSELMGALTKPWYLQTFYIFCFTVLLVNSSFIWRAKAVIKQHQDAQFPNLLIKGQYAFLAILGCWIIAFAASFIGANEFLVNLNAYNFAFLSFAFLTFGLAFLALIKPESFYFLTQTYDSSETYVLQQVANSIIQYFSDEAPYLQNGFSLHHLANKIDTNATLTSKAINRILKTSFHDLINEYRVKHFLKIAREEKWKNLTHWALAQESGFGNKVSFYKAFKKITGSTPKHYLKLSQAAS